MNRPARYFGGKNGEWQDRIALLMPLDDSKTTFIDCCFGMGNVSCGIAYGMPQFSEIVAYEKEPALYLLHMVIKYDIQELIDRISTVENTEKYFMECRELVESYNKKELGKCDPVEIAIAVITTIRFSVNLIRNNYRKKFYEKYAVDSEEYKKKKREYEAIVEKFYTQQKIELWQKHEQMQAITLRNEDFSDRLEDMAKPNSFIFIDPPYLPQKRGRKTKKSADKLVNAGYMCEMSRDDHMKLISQLIKLKDCGAYFMVCSNFELDENGEVKGLAEDPYTRLLRHGYKMVVVQKKYAVQERPVSQTKRGKVEVVYINYTPSVSPLYYRIYGYNDVMGKN